MHAGNGMLWLGSMLPPAAAPREIGDRLEKLGRAMALIDACTREFG
jgi:hypothetical protein